MTQPFENADAASTDAAPNASAPSPFLPGTHIQFAWDSTSLGYAKTCPRLYQYQMIEGWQSRSEAIHLRFGIEYHQALHDYELSKITGIPHDDSLHDTIRALLTRIGDWDPEPRTQSEGLKTKDNLVRTVVWYLDQFKDDPAKTIILADGTPAIEVSFRFELDQVPMIDSEERHGEPQPYILCGHLDRIVDFQGQRMIMDRKTTTSTPGSYYFDQYEPDNQMTLYILASQVLFGTPLKGVVIDAAQIAVGFSRFVRGMTYRTPDQLQEWLQDLPFLFAQYEDYAAEGYWPMNDTACGKYGGCRFRSICSKSPQVRERFLESNFVKAEPWNPLKSR